LTDTAGVTEVTPDVDGGTVTLSVDPATFDGAIALQNVKDLGEEYETTTEL